MSNKNKLVVLIEKYPILGIVISSIFVTVGIFMYSDPGNKFFIPKKYWAIFIVVFFTITALAFLIKIISRIKNQTSR